MPNVVIDELRIKRTTATTWASLNPVLLAGEPGLESDTRLLKFGDGVTTWNSLSYGGVAAHNHDGTYSLVAHDHSGVYSPVAHDHSGTYSPVAHNHDGTYSLVAHDHSGTYSPVAHNHDGTYLTQATADTLYQPIGGGGGGGGGGGMTLLTTTQISTPVTSVSFNGWDTSKRYKIEASGLSFSAQDIVRWSPLYPDGENAGPTAPPNRTYTNQSIGAAVGWRGTGLAAGGPEGNGSVNDGIYSKFDASSYVPYLDFLTMEITWDLTTYSEFKPMHVVWAALGNNSSGIFNFHGVHTFRSVQSNGLIWTPPDGLTFDLGDIFLSQSRVCNSGVFKLFEMGVA